MFKKFGAALATCALAATLGVVAIPGASASSEPAVPVVKLTAATCDNKTNRIEVTNFDPNFTQYRLVVTSGGTASSSSIPRNVASSSQVAKRLSPFSVA